MKQAGAWYELVYADQTVDKFQAAKWAEKLSSEKFKTRVLEIMDEEAESFQDVLYWTPAYAGVTEDFVPSGRAN